MSNDEIAFRVIMAAVVIVSTAFVVGFVYVAIQAFRLGA